jgi:hypothetical protein
MAAPVFLNCKDSSMFFLKNTLNSRADTEEAAIAAVDRIEVV